MSRIANVFRRAVNWVWEKVGRRDKGRLYHFEDVLPYEFAAINHRRGMWGRDRVAPSKPPREGSIEAVLGTPHAVPEEASDREAESKRSAPSPDPRILFDKVPQGEGPFDPAAVLQPGGADPLEPDPKKMRPKPVPCDANGLAFSGGGIRSAAVCLGALQALQNQKRLPGIDYLSTVSGGGYIGACLSAAMTPLYAGRRGVFPFARDVADTPAVAHLRNYSNYLMPRGRSGLRNAFEATAIVLRGLAANAVAVLSVILFLAAVSRLLRELLTYPGWALPGAGAALAILLVVWALLRSWINWSPIVGDTSGLMLSASRRLLQATIVIAVVLLQPIAIDWAQELARHPPLRVSLASLKTILAGLAAFIGAVAAAAGKMGRFLEGSRRAGGFTVLLKRVASQAVLVAAGVLLPLILWGLYLWLCIPGAYPETAAASVKLLSLKPPQQTVVVYCVVGAALWMITAPMKANAYSLHGFYRDRLSKAFLFRPPADFNGEDPLPLDHMKLSDLAASEAPYHIINAAMNVQNSAEANRRGRNADFFMFSSMFVGSDLTFYTPTRAGAVATLEMEKLDRRLDLATAMAVSGAAVSANMGSSTVRVLSPTLALLNVRLGYWLPNPRHMAVRGPLRRGVRKAGRALFEKLFLAREALNLHDEKSGEVFLTDGGHIENLGIYELLKRGCRLIVAVDAEADPTYSFSSLLKLERYARIDLGIRIVLPWEEIADTARAAADWIESEARYCERGPHCAVGTIQYEDGNRGVLVYFKASMTGDEKDYVLDYKRRNPQFPHETTGDQFFSEEQFEMYRALGFHMVDGFFSGSDEFASSADVDANALKALVDCWLPALAYA